MKMRFLKILLDFIFIYMSCHPNYKKQHHLIIFRRTSHAPSDYQIFEVFSTSSLFPFSPHTGRRQMLLEIITHFHELNPKEP